MDVGQNRGSTSLSLRLLGFHSAPPSLIFLLSPYKPKHRQLCINHPGTHMHTNTHKATSSASMCKEETAKHMHRLHLTHLQTSSHAHTHRHLHPHKGRYSHLHTCTHPHCAHKYRHTYAQLKTTHTYGNPDTCEQNRHPVLSAPPFRE